MTSKDFQLTTLNSDALSYLPETHVTSLRTIVNTLRPFVTSLRPLVTYLGPQGGQKRPKGIYYSLQRGHMGLRKVT